MYCLNPPLTKYPTSIFHLFLRVPKGRWFCGNCRTLGHEAEPEEAEEDDEIPIITEAATSPKSVENPAEIVLAHRLMHAIEILPKDVTVYELAEWLLTNGSSKEFS